MVIVEYSIRGESVAHTRYFPNLFAAKKFCRVMQSDPECVSIRVVG